MPEPWYEDDRFWALLEPQLFDELRKKSAAEEAAQTARLLKLEPPAQILDLCCGPGRHSVELAKLGYRVTGVDRTARYLERAKAHAAANGVTVEFVQDDMRAFLRPAGFDGAINMFTSFGYFEEVDEDRQVLRNLQESLRPGGRLVMDMAGKEVLARIYTPRHWVELPDESLVLFDREVTPGWGAVRNRWIYMTGAGRTEFNFTHRIYSAAELAASLEGAGFVVEGTYGGLDARPYDRSAERLVAVARVK
jgi:SAM-dependent methyltransferase